MADRIFLQYGQDENSYIYDINRHIITRLLKLQNDTMFGKFENYVIYKIKIIQIYKNKS